MPDRQFSDAEIQQRAYEIYQKRDGTPGDPNADWQEAIRQLQQERSFLKQKGSIFSCLNLPFVAIEKRAIEPTANWLDRADIFRIIEKISPIIEAIGVIAIPVAIWWFSETSQEAKERQEKAIRAQTAVQNYLNQLSDILATGDLKTNEDLQTIVRASTLALLDSPDLQPNPDLEKEENWRNDRKGQTIGYLYEAGLIQVVPPEQLQNNNQVNVQEEPVISLENANLSSSNLISADFSNAFLENANLSFSNLIGVDLSNAFLVRTSFRSADFWGTNLSNANLKSAFFQDANLNQTIFINANLKSANFSNANLESAYLINANLESVYFINANLSNAFLRRANLHNAFLRDANLNDADLRSTNLSNTNFVGADLRFADLRDAKNWTEEQLSGAKLCSTRLPAGTKLDPDRDCKELEISPD